MAKSKTGAKKRGRAEKKDAAKNNSNGSAAVVGFEQKLWQAADEPRDNLGDRFKDVIRGLVTVANGLAPIREKMSDGHAGERKPTPDPARVVEYAAKTVSAFLVESHTYQLGKGLIGDVSALAKEASA